MSPSYNKYRLQVLCYHNILIAWCYLIEYNKKKFTDVIYNFHAVASNIPNSSLSAEHAPYDKENTLTYDEESDWLHRNDAYQIQQIGGRIRAVAMPLGHNMQSISTVVRDIAQGML